MYYRLYIYIGIAEFFRVRRLLVRDTRGQRTPHKVSTEKTQRHTGMGHAPTRTLPPTAIWAARREGLGEEASVRL